MEKELPIYTTQGVEFIVDVDKNELREKANPENSYPLYFMNDLGDAGYAFEHFDKATGKTLEILLPPFVALDPEGMARKYEKTLEELKSSTDFDVMVDQDLLKKRLDHGHLPTIDLAGQTFYADARIDLLRPKDDFSTMGIRFADLDDYYVLESNSYIFPYDPKTHELVNPDWENMTEYPKKLLLIEIPDVKVLDPVGWNRRNGYPETDDLKAIGLKLEFKAEIIPWNKSGIDELIAENRSKQPTKNTIKENNNLPEKKRGRKM